MKRPREADPRIRAQFIIRGTPRAGRGAPSTTTLEDRYCGSAAHRDFETPSCGPRRGLSSNRPPERGEHAGPWARAASFE
jgi:hypothetical protein